jgi:rusticyanin
MRRKHLILIFIGSVAILLVLGTMVLLGFGNSGLFLNRNRVNPSGTGNSFGNMGGGQGMMGSGGSKNASQTFTPQELQQLAQNVVKGAMVNGNTVHYITPHAEIVALGAPPGRPGMFWEVDGKINPTIVVAAKSEITLVFADGDPGQHHGFELTTAAPPYARMAMMTGAVASPGAFIIPVEPPSGNTWHGRTITFTAPSPGTYYYICPVPGHAQQGMWGRFIVS